MDIEKEINVLSLFDGIACGKVALERAGTKTGIQLKRSKCCEQAKKEQAKRLFNNHQCCIESKRKQAGKIFKDIESLKNKSKK